MQAEVPHLTVALVEAGDYLGRGREYVRKMRAMVSRNLTIPHEIVCLTDAEHDGVRCIPLEPGRSGWWNKIQLFKPGLFEGRALYIDLDSIITGSLDAYASVTGIIHLSDWGWDSDTYGSGVMVWDAGDHAEIYEQWTPELTTGYRGDQDWMTALGGWAALPKDWQRSYRYVSTVAPQPGCRICCAHGSPKPHEIRGWVPEYWRE